MRQSTLRHIAGFALAVLFVVLSVAGRAPAKAQQPNRAALIVDFGDHHITRCVEFTESEITGYDVLRRAGLDLVVDASNPMGVIMCDIEGTSGCPASNCFCKCPGSPCVYWSYHYLENGSWRYAQLGASARKVQNGDVEGWGWGEGKINASGHEPPLIPFDQICAPPATSTPLPTDTPIPPTATPIPPTDTPVSTETARPTTVPAPEVWFRLDQNPIAAGSCTGLRWDTANIQEVRLDGQEVTAAGSREVCPTTSTSYELTVTGLDDKEESYQLTLGVTGTAPATSAPQVTVLAAADSPTPDAEAESAPAATTAPGDASTPSASPTAPAASERLASPTSEPEVSPRPTASPQDGAKTQPTATAAQIAASQDSEGSRTDSAEKDAASESDDAIPPSVLLPIGYIAFSLMAGGLLGWLIYVLRFRGPRA